MTVDYYSGEGESIKGCVANTSLRRSLMSLVYSKLALDDKSCEDEENEVNGTLPESCHTAGGGRDMRFATMHMGICMCRLCSISYLIFLEHVFK